MRESFVINNTSDLEWKIILHRGGRGRRVRLFSSKDGTDRQTDRQTDWLTD